jgi:hypothetical protein
MEQVQNQERKVDINAVISQSLAIQADATTQTRTITGLLAQAVAEIERLTKENESLKNAKTAE